jgi:hypothetical protein
MVRLKNKTSVLNDLFSKIDELEVLDKTIDGFSSKLTEPVITGNWQEVILFCVSELGRAENQQKEIDIATADDVILKLLSFNNSSREARAFAVFAMQCLIEEPSIKKETASMVLNAAISSLEDFDGRSIPKTLIDEVFQEIIKSSFEELCYEHLLKRYIQSNSEYRVKIGSMFASLVSKDLEALNIENADRILNPLLEKLAINNSLEERADTALKLVNIFFFLQISKNNTTINFLSDTPLLQNLINILLSTSANDVESNDAVSFATLWALVWLTNSKDYLPSKIYTFTEKELIILRQIVANNNRYAVTRSYASLILSSAIADKSFYAQVDWLYEWAVIADGDKPHKKVPQIKHSYQKEDIAALKTLITSDVPLGSKKDVAIALGRLGCFVPEMVEPLLQVFRDDLKTDDTRNEALVYLAFVGGYKVANELLQIINSSELDADKHDLWESCILGLIGMGDIGVLRYQLEHGDADRETMNAYAYTLAGLQDTRGHDVLESLKKHEQKKIRDAVENAISKATEWDSQKSKESDKNSSENGNTFFKDRFIAKQGHLIHKLKAKDSSGRWAYYFVYVRPALEQDFMKALDSNESIDLEDYGKVVASNYGEEPNETTKDFLNKKYGFNA